MIGARGCDPSKIITSYTSEYLTPCQDARAPSGKKKNGSINISAGWTSGRERRKGGIKVSAGWAPSREAGVSRGTHISAGWTPGVRRSEGTNGSAG